MASSRGNKSHSQSAQAARLAAERRQRQNKVIAALVALALVLGSVAFALGGSDGSDDQAASTGTTETTADPSAPSAAAPPVPPGRSITGQTPCPPTTGNAERASQFENPPPRCIDPTKTYVARFDTTEGIIAVRLDTQKTPGTTNNFVVLSRYNYYDGSAIVRTNTGIDIIQGGAPTTQTNADPGPGYNIPDEGVPFEYGDGDLIMANTGRPNSSGAQFFFGTGPNVALLNQSGSYLKFGTTIEGQDVLDRIIGLHRASSPGQPSEGAPSKPVVIRDIVIEER